MVGVQASQNYKENAPRVNQDKDNHHLNEWCAHPVKHLFVAHRNICLHGFQVDIQHVVAYNNHYENQENGDMLEYFVKTFQVYNSFSPQENLEVSATNRAINALSPHNESSCAVGVEDPVRTVAGVDEVALDSEQLQVLLVLYIVLLQLLQEIWQELLLHTKDRVVTLHEEDRSLSLAQVANYVFIIRHVVLHGLKYKTHYFVPGMFDFRRELVFQS